MKKRFHYIVWLFSLTFAFTACEKIEPELFDKDANGAYFDYQHASDFERMLNFSDHIVGKPDTVPRKVIPLPTDFTGRLS